MTLPSKKKSKIGLPPGALIYTGNKKSGKVKITVLEYTSEQFNEYVYESAEEVFKHKTSKELSWINIDGLHNIDIIKKITSHFELDLLMMEDVLNINQRPKINEFKDHMFFTFKMLGLDKKGVNIKSEQISIVLGKSWIISFQEQEGDIFNTLRERLRTNKGVVRQKKGDYLLYRLVDIAVDYYFHVIESIDKATDELETIVLNNYEQTSLQKIQKLKKKTSILKKSVFPLREALHSVSIEKNPLISDETLHYLKDVYEHVIQVQETLDYQRENIGYLTELYLSGLNNKMNQIMKILTIISTIFIPLTFIVGVYGMNFKYMPELEWVYSYPIAWCIMLAITGILVYYFKKKNWL